MPSNWGHASPWWKSIAKRIAHLTTFRQGDAEGLPFDDEAFDAVVSECSFCTFLDKATAAVEMARVLGSGGRLGLTDTTVSGPLPDDIQNLLAWVACVAGTSTSEDYVATLRAAGFAGFTVEDQQGALLEMVDDVRRKLLGVEPAVGLGKLSRSQIPSRGGSHACPERSRRAAVLRAWEPALLQNRDLLKLDLGNLDLNKGKRLARRAVELIEEGTIGYTLIAARLELPTTPSTPPAPAAG